MIATTIAKVLLDMIIALSMYVIMTTTMDIILIVGLLTDIAVIFRLLPQIRLQPLIFLSVSMSVVDLFLKSGRILWRKRFKSCLVAMVLWAGFFNL